MVRNIGSMQSLRDKMDDCDISSSPERRSTYSPPQPFAQQQHPPYGSSAQPWPTSSYAPHMSHMFPPMPGHQPYSGQPMSGSYMPPPPPPPYPYPPAPMPHVTGLPPWLARQQPEQPAFPEPTSAPPADRSNGHDRQRLSSHSHKESLRRHDAEQGLYQRRILLLEREKQEMAYGSPSSRWERDHNQILTKPLSECTAEEIEQFERLWKKYLTEQATKRRRSRGQPAPDAVKDEAQRFKAATRENSAKYTKPFCDFLTQNPTVFHAVNAIKEQLKNAGWTELSERDGWDIKPSGKYFVERNGSSMIAFSVGAKYKPGNGAAILAGHVDALTAKLKPISQVPNKAGYLQLGIAQYAGAPNTTWWDRDLGIGGRVLVKQGDKIVTKLVKLDWPIARIPTLAPHFGAPSQGPFNPETQMVPIIGLEGTNTTEASIQTAEPFSQPSLLGSFDGPAGNFSSTQPPRLVKAIAQELGLNTVATQGTIVNWELELFDTQPATVGGLDKEFIFAGRIDDKLCSWAAIQALVESEEMASDDSSIVKVVGLFDDEEIGSLLRQGARGNFLPQTIERAVGSLADGHSTSELIGRTYANSFLVSSDVTHAVNPNFLGSYLENHSPHLNVGLVVSADSNGHMTTDSVSTAILQRCADRIGAKLQVFQIRNDSRSGGTVGPMLSAMTGIRAIDAGIPQLSMHSIRATTGALDPGLGVLMFLGFLNGFEDVDKEFRN